MISYIQAIVFMVNREIDFNERLILVEHPDVLDVLLSDRSSKKNIKWCTDNYAKIGIHQDDYMLKESIIYRKESLIKPRVLKSSVEQKKRIKDMAEVFTPSWICNKQNNMVDDVWFGYSNAFNKETESGWITNEKVVFINDKKWEDYVELERLEITCGEAPYLVSRYDATSGQYKFMLNGNRDKAFFIARLGARIVGFEDYFQGLLEEIKRLDDKSLFKALKCASFDSVYRAGIIVYRNVEEINPDKITLNNIRILIERSLSFFEEYGPVTSDGFTFEGAYTSKVDSGDGDFLTKDTLWDFKVSKDEPKAKHTFQLLMYYLMGKKSGKRKFKEISKIGFFNLRLNRVYLYDMSKMPVEILDEIERNVIGY